MEQHKFEKILNKYRDKGLLSMETIVELLQNDSVSFENIKDTLARNRDFDFWSYPKELSKLINLFICHFKAQNILIPYFGTGELAEEVKNVKVRGFEIYDKMYIIGKRFFPNVDLTNTDYLKTKINDKYDFIVLFPPLGLKTSTEDGHELIESLSIKKALTELDTGGHLFALVSQSFLISSQFEDFRKKIIEKYSLKMVVELSPYSFKHVGIETYLLLIEVASDKVEDVFYPLFTGSAVELFNNYINHTGNFWVKADRIADRLDRHFFDPKYDELEKSIQSHSNVKLLPELGDIVSGYRFKREKIHGTKYLILAGQNIQNGKLVDSNKDIFTDEVDDPRFKNAVLRDGDVVMRTIFGDPKIFIYKKGDTPAIVKENFVIIRSKFNRYIAYYLQTEQGRKIFEGQIDRKMHGTTIRYISLSQLQQIRIPVLPLADLNIVVDETVPASQRYEIMLNKVLIPKLEAKGWSVEREVRVGDKFRLDLGLYKNGKLTAIVEIKRLEGELSYARDQVKHFLSNCDANTAFIVRGTEVFQLLDGELVLIEDFPSVDEIRFQRQPTLDYKYYPEKEEELIATKNYLGLIGVIKNDIEDIKASQHRTEIKVDQILEVVLQLQNEMSAIKSSNREDEEKLKLIYSLIKNKFETTSSVIQNKIAIYEELAADMIDKWENLDVMSKKFFPIAEYLYTEMQKLEEPDFSPMILELCRVIENELATKIFIPFSQEIVLTNNFEEMLVEDSKNKDLDRFIKTLRKVKLTQCEPKFTLGDMNYYLSIASSRKSADSFVLKSLRHFIDGLYDHNILLKKDFQKALQNIIDNFRNKCAHPSIMTLDDATKCRKIVPDEINNFLNSEIEADK